MLNQKLIDYALRQAGLMIAEHLDLGYCDAEETTSKLIAVLDAQEVTDASDRRLGLAGGEVTPFHAAMKEAANWGGVRRGFMLIEGPLQCIDLFVPAVSAFIGDLVLSATHRGPDRLHGHDPGR